MKTLSVVTGVALLFARALVPAPGSLQCDLTGYKIAPGLAASVAGDQLSVTWAGDRGTELRARYTIADGQPLIRDLAVRKASASFSTLGENLKPE